MTPTVAPVEISCAVEVFIAAALLHRDNPGRPGFTIQEIVGRAVKEDITGELRPGVSVHASQHCVANRAPNPGKHRMLFATGKHTRRLVLPNDIAHADRTGKLFPDVEEVPERYLPLLEWAKERFEQAMKAPDFWARDADERVRQLRSDSHLSVGYHLEKMPAQSSPWLADLLALRLAGLHLADGVDPDEHVRQLREGWD